MARTVTPNQNDNILFDERIIDGDGDTLSVDSVELDQIDGITQSGGDRTPGWLSYSTASNTLASGATEFIVTVEIDSTQVSDNTVYTIEIIVSDPSIGDTRYVDFAVRPKKAAAKNIYHSVGEGFGTVRRINGDGSDGASKTFSDTPTAELPLAATDNEEVIVGLKNRIERWDENLSTKRWENKDIAGDTLAMTFGTDGFVYVLDGSGQLLQINRSGTTVATIRGTDGFNDRVKPWIVPISNGNVFLYIDDDSRAYLVDRLGNEIWRVDRGARRSFGHADQDRLGLVGNDGIYVYDRDGNLRWNSNYFENQYADRPDAADYNPYSNRLAVIGASDSNLRLALFDDNGNVKADTRLEDFLPIGSFDSRGWECAWDENDNVYVLVGDENDFSEYRGVLAKFDRDGGYIWDNVLTSYLDNFPSHRIAVPRFLG